MQYVFACLQVHFEYLNCLVRRSLRGAGYGACAEFVVEFVVGGYCIGFDVYAVKRKRHERYIHAVVGEKSFGHIGGHIRRDCEFLHCFLLMGH